MALLDWGAGAWVPYQQTYVFDVPREFATNLYVTGMLVHEACHHHQASDGRLAGLTSRQKEIECWSIQIDYIEEVAPMSRYIPELWRGLRKQ